MQPKFIRKVNLATGQDFTVDVLGVNKFKADTNGIGATALFPLADDGGALGSTALKFSDVFLASGCVININSGAVTITHSTNSLAFAGASSGYSFDAVIASNGDISSSDVIVPESLGDDILTDGGLELWDDSDTLTNWTDGQAGPPGGSLAQETVEVYAGTYSAKLTNSWYIAQTKTSLTVADNYRLKYYSKGSGTSSAFFLNDTAGGATKIYNFTNNDWNDNWTGSPVAANLVTTAAGGTFALVTVEDVSVPATGTLTSVIQADTVSTVYVDTISLQKVTAATNVVAHDFYSANNHASYTSSDYVFKYRTTAGTARTQLALRGDGLIESYFSTLTWTGIGFSGINSLNVKEFAEIYDATNDGNPYLKIGSSAAECLIAQPIYDAGAQTLDYVLFDTAVASATADKGKYVFKVDGVEVCQIKDDGITMTTKMIQGAQGTDIASANDATLTITGNYFDITGNTQINTLSATGIQAGTLIVLQFDSNPVVKHATAGAGAQFQLAGAGDFSATAGDTLGVIFDGTYWRECFRTAI